MLLSGFTNAYFTKSLVCGLVITSIAVSVLDIKYLFYIQVQPHLWRYHQFWRLLVYQVCYLNSTEVLFGAILFYQLRLVERLWGSKKFLSFLFCTLPYTALIPALLLSLVIRPLSMNSVNYLPAGPTGLIFALLAQFHSAIPHTYKYTVSTSEKATPPPSTSTSTSTTVAPPSPSALVLTDKSTTYCLALQLALSQFPHSLLPAITGWTIGYAWRMDLLPKCAVAWRVPKWVYTDTQGEAYRQSMGLVIDEPAAVDSAAGRWSLFGRRGMRQDLAADGGRYEGLRRRLETESRAAVAGSESTSGETNGASAEDEPARPMGRQLFNRIRGVF